MKYACLILFAAFPALAQIPQPYYPNGPSQYAYAGSTTFAQLPAVPSAGTSSVYCTDCAPTSPCTAGGTGAPAVSNGTIWTCGNGISDDGSTASSPRNGLFTGWVRSGTSGLGCIDVSDVTGAFDHVWCGGGANGTNYFPATLGASGQVMRGGAGGQTSWGYQGGQACLASPVTTSSTTELQIVGTPAFPAHTLQPGSTLSFRAHGLQTDSGTSGNMQFQIRIGTGSLSGTSIVTLSPSVNGTTQANSAPYWITGLLTVQPDGTSALAELQVLSTSGTGATAAFSAANGASAATTPITFDPEAVNLVELTAKGSAANVGTYTVACIEVVKP